MSSSAPHLAPARAAQPPQKYQLINGQQLCLHAQKGSRIVITHGSAHIAESPRWQAETMLFQQQRVREGEQYLVQHTGLLTLSHACSDGQERVQLLHFPMPASEKLANWRTALQNWLPAWFTQAIFKSAEPSRGSNQAQATARSKASRQQLL